MPTVSLCNKAPIHWNIAGRNIKNEFIKFRVKHHCGSLGLIFSYMIDGAASVKFCAYHNSP